MGKYYYFRTKRVTGRMLLFPLPNQTTYISLRERNAPVITNRRVQVNRSSNHLVAILPEGTIFGVKMVGNERQSKLSVYTRNNDAFYRVDENIVPIYQSQLFASRGLSGFNPDDYAVPAGVYYEMTSGISMEMVGEMRMDFKTNFLPGLPLEASENENVFGQRNETNTNGETVSNTDRTDNVSEKLYLYYRELERTVFANSERNYSDKLRFLYMSGKLLKDITKGFVTFQYYKNNGELRTACGTINKEAILAAGGTPSETYLSLNNMRCLVYFDRDRNADRQFCWERLVIS